MRLAGRLIILAWLFTAAVGCVGQAAERTSRGPGLAGTNPIQQAELRGRVVCLPEEMHRQHGAELPTNHEHLWAFKTTDRKLFTLLRTKFSEAIFLDEQVRSKELLLKARVFPNAQVLEVTNIHSLRNGAEQDLYYYCDICSIKSVSPEICACCQGPVRLVEKPLTDKSERN